MSNWVMEFPIGSILRLWLLIGVLAIIIVNTNIANKILVLIINKISMEIEIKIRSNYSVTKLIHCF